MGHKAEAIIWHEETLLKGGHDATELRSALSSFRRQGLLMAVVTDGNPDLLRGTLLRHDFSQYFSPDASKVAVSSAAHYQSTVHDHALTRAFAQALKTLGTDRAATVGIVADCEQTRLARYAGLPVVAFSNDEPDVRDRTLYHGARTAVSTPIDLEDAVLQFRPFKEAKWYPIAAPHRG